MKKVTLNNEMPNFSFSSNETSFESRELLKLRKLYLNGDIEEDIVTKLIQQIHILDHQSHDPIELFISSPGGSISDGFALIDVMNKVKSPIHTIGFALNASMGSVILMSGKKGNRSMYPNGSVMIHRASWGTAPDYDGHQQKAADWLKSECEGLYKHIAKCTGKKTSTIKDDADKGLWLSSKQALKYKVVDKIL